MDPSIYRSRIKAEVSELRDLSTVSKEGRAPVELDQQSVGRLSRMDAMQQQSMDIAREDRRQARLHVLVAALGSLDAARTFRQHSWMSIRPSPCVWDARARRGGAGPEGHVRT